MVRFNQHPPHTPKSDNCLSVSEKKLEKKRFSAFYQTFRILFCMVLKRRCEKSEPEATLNNLQLYCGYCSPFIWIQYIIFLSIRHSWNKHLKYINIGLSYLPTYGQILLFSEVFSNAAVWPDHKPVWTRSPCSKHCAVTRLSRKTAGSRSSVGVLNTSTKSYIKKT